MGATLAVQNLRRIVYIRWCFMSRKWKMMSIINCFGAPLHAGYTISCGNCWELSCCCHHYEKKSMESSSSVLMWTNRTRIGEENKSSWRSWKYLLYTLVEHFLFCEVQIWHSKDYWWLNALYRNSCFGVGFFTSVNILNRVPISSIN